MKRKKLQIIIGVSVAFVFLLSIFTITSGEVLAQTLERKVIKIGVAASLKRPFGIASLRGAEMAVKEINSAGGVLGSKIELFSADTEATAPKATEVIEKLVFSNKVDAIVGAYSSEESTAFQEQSAKLKLNILCHGTTHILDDKYNAKPAKYKYYWNYEPSDRQFADNVVERQLPLLIDGLKKGLGLKKINVAVFTDVALWTEAMHDIFLNGVKKHPDCNLVYIGKLSRDGVDFTAELTEMRAKNVQLVVVACGYAAGYTLIKQAYDVKLPAIFAGTNTLAWSTDFIKAVGINAAAYICTNGFATMPTTPRTIQLLKEYERTYGGGPHMDVGLTYDGVKAYAKAVETAKSLNQDKVSAALSKIRLSQKEAWGAKEFKFEKNHRLRVSAKDGMIFYTYQYLPSTGAASMLEPAEYKTGTFLIPPWMVTAWKK